MAAQSAWYGQTNFFPMRVHSKKIFLAWGYHILATRKNNFHGSGGSQRVPGGLLGHFMAKKSYFFLLIYNKIPFLLAVYDLFTLYKTIKAYIYIYILSNRT